MTTIKKSVWARVSVLRAVLAAGGLMMASSAMAGPAACAPVGCDTSCAAPAACCEPACDAPAGCCEDACGAGNGCCETSCAAPDACCGDACDGGCGDGGCGLFQKKSFLSGCGDDCCDTGCAAPAGCCDDACDSGCGLGGGDGLFSGMCGNGCGDSCVDSCDGCGSGCGGGELGDPWTLQGALCPSDDCCDAESPWNFGGWVQFGYHSDSTGLFNSRPGQFQNHQSWVYLERVADGSNGIGLGGRVDFMYGQDAGDTQAFGNPPGSWDYLNGWDRGAQYGFAMPQLYAEVAIGENLSIIAGHFYTLLGYEVVTAPDNFFYSHAFTMYNSEAFTHTGVLATYAASDNLTLYAGWTLGWDTGFDQYDLFGQEGSSFLGGFSVGVGDNASFTYITTFGDFGAIGDGYSHSMVLDVAVSDNLNYVVQSDVLQTDALGLADIETVGINQYLFYTLSDRIAVGGRAEWWKADSDSIYAVTGGVNIRPTANLVVRPEVRYEWDPGQTNGILVEDENTIFGIDAIVTF